MHIDAGNLSALLEADLYSAGWNGQLLPYPDQPVTQFAMSHLRRSLIKKYLPGTSDRNPEGDKRALDLFLKTNESCRNWSLDTSRMDTFDEIVIGEMKYLIDSFFYPTVQPMNRDFILNREAIYNGFGLGNGANIGAPDTDLYSKLSLSTMAATNPALHALYGEAILSNPTWSGMEHSRSKKFGSKIVTGSRLSFVPKTTEISRTICTEPVLNMLFQKGIANCMERRLIEVFGIDLAQQADHNRKLARIGSETGKFGTIDLSSASDSISLALCQYLLPRRVYDLLCLTRSPVTTLPGGRVEELHMVSSMGNAFTFPLQTMIFAAVVYGVYRAYGFVYLKPRHNATGNFAVFGDDIIVLTQAYARVCKILSLLGFSVNVDKSYNDGTFRESCGLDFYRGHNVRGVYIKRIRDANDCYSAINRLTRWCATHGILLPRLIKYLVNKVRFLPIPYDEMDDYGIKVPESMLNKRIYHKDTGAIMYRYSKLTDNTVSLLPKKGSPKLRNWDFNPDGLLVAFLAGSIRNGSVVLRTSRRRAYIRKRYSSRWDYIPFARDESRDYAENWKVSARALLSVRES
jgi:hypothetical protein